MKRRLLWLLGTAIVGATVALVYLVFENALHEAINFVWDVTFDSENNRLVTVLLTVVFGVVYFGAVHFFRSRESSPKTALVAKLGIVLGVGFLSLFAGAALGPEAVLMPAAVLVGHIISRAPVLSQFKNQLALAGTVALFVAFFNSLAGGLLGLYLALKSRPTKLRPADYVGLSLAAAVALAVLSLASEGGSFEYPEQPALLSWLTVLFSGGFAVLGVVYVKFFTVLHGLVERLRHYSEEQHWLRHGLIASFGLAGLFLLGGYYVQFTGNTEIVPIFSEATAIGAIGLLWISFVKVVAIAWSTVMGYRGGLIFPFIFLASTVVAAAYTITPEFNAVVGIFAFLAGALYGDRSTKLLVGSH